MQQLDSAIWLVVHDAGRLPKAPPSLSVRLTGRSSVQVSCPCHAMSWLSDAIATVSTNEDRCNVAPITAALRFSVQPSSIVYARNKLLHARCLSLVPWRNDEARQWYLKELLHQSISWRGRFECNARLDTMVVRSKGETANVMFV